MSRTLYDCFKAKVCTDQILCEACHELEMEMLQEYSDSLIEQIQGKFLAEDIHDLAIGFHSLEVIRYDSRVIASIYSWALSDPNIQKELAERYFQHLKEKLHGEKSTD